MPWPKDDPSILYKNLVLSTELIKELIRHSDEGLTLEMSAFRISVRWPIYIINSVDKTKFLYTTSPPTQHHSFFRNYPFILPFYKLYIPLTTKNLCIFFDRNCKPPSYTSGKQAGKKCGKGVTY